MISNIAFCLANSAQITHLENKSYDELLILADEKRSSDHQLSNTIIKLLSHSINKLSSQQKDHWVYLKAYQLSFQGEYEKAIELLKSLLKGTAPNELKFRATEILINLYANKKDWQASVNYISQLIALTPLIDNEKLIQASKISIAIFYNELGQYQQALYYLTKIEKKSLENTRDWCVVNQQLTLAKLRLFLAKTHSLVHPDSELVSSITQALNACNQANATLFTQVIYTYEAELYLAQQQPNLAIKKLNDNLPSIQAAKYPALTIVSYNLLAQAYWRNQNTQLAKKYANLAYEEGQLLSEPLQEVETYKLLQQLAEDDGNFRLALTLHKKYSNAKQNVTNEAQAKDLAFQLASNIALTNRSEIKQLNQQNKLLNSQNILSEQQKENTILLILLLLIFFAALLNWAYRSWLVQINLRQLTERDELTQAQSRSHFLSLSKLALQHSEKQHEPLSCLLFDLDHFKKINDNFGHTVGDNVLKAVSHACQDICRPSDLFGRLGGEEFALLLPNCSIIMAEDLANSCREKILQINYESLGLNQPITASFGVTDVEISGYDITNILADADSAMYSAKQHGRNTVSLYR